MSLNKNDADDEPGNVSEQYLDTAKCTQHSLLLSSGGSKEDRTGFEPLPDTDSAGAAVILAARKSRQYKNIRALKIGLVIISVSAVLAGLTAFLITRSINSPVTNFADRQSRVMEVNIKDQESLKTVGEANDMFGGDCFSKMSSGDDGNLLFSPFSASVALSLVAAGAKADTLQQLTSGKMNNEHC